MREKKRKRQHLLVPLPMLVLLLPLGMIKLVQAQNLYTYVKTRVIDSEIDQDFEGPLPNHSYCESAVVGQGPNGGYVFFASSVIYAGLNPVTEINEGPFLGFQIFAGSISGMSGLVQVQRVLVPYLAVKLMLWVISNQMVPLI